MNSSFRHLEAAAAAAESSIEALENHREIASKLIKALFDYLPAEANNTDDIHLWHQELIILGEGERGKPPETVIVVVGNMGAGKSTAINALIDEARLLPTSGYDACTSVATEVRYNYSADPDEAYRAEITFITREELLNEIHILREDVLSDSEGAGASTSSAAPAAPATADYDDHSHAEIAWDKIHAVWPRLTRAELAAPGFDVRALLEDPMIRICLGQTHQVCHPTAAGLGRDLGRFVANRDNAALAKGAGGVGAEQQLWPLVDKVNIFVKAEVLSTGAVIRDMVGLIFLSLSLFSLNVCFSYHCAPNSVSFNSLVAKMETPQGLPVQQQMGTSATTCASSSRSNAQSASRLSRSLSMTPARSETGSNSTAGLTTSLTSVL